MMCILVRDARGCLVCTDKSGLGCKEDVLPAEEE